MKSLCLCVPLRLGRMACLLLAKKINIDELMGTFKAARRLTCFSMAGKVNTDGLMGDLRDWLLTGQHCRGDPSVSAIHLSALEGLWTQTFLEYLRGFLFNLA